MHLFYLREMWRSFRHHRGLGWTAIVSLTATLTLSGIFLLLSWNARQALAVIGDRREMIVYLDDGITASDREVLIGRLRDLYGQVTYVNKEQAWKEFTAQVGDATLLEAVGDNPLPASLHIQLKPQLLTPDAMDQAAKQIGGFPEVEDVRYGSEWVRRLDQVGHSLFALTLAVLALVGLAVVFIVYNTIRFSVLARRQQLEIMSRLGASDDFVATPFVLEAMFEAAVAALLALGILFAAEQAIASRLLGGISFLPPLAVLAFVGVVLGLAALATLLALSRVLRAVGP